MYSAIQVLSTYIVVLSVLAFFIFGPKKIMDMFFKWTPIAGFALSAWWLIIWAVDRIQISYFGGEGFGIERPGLAFVVMLGSVSWATVYFKVTEVFTPHSPSGE